MCRAYEMNVTLPNDFQGFASALIAGNPSFVGKSDDSCEVTAYQKRRWCGRVDSNHHGIATASPSSWCVCQFRHDRTEVRTHCSRAW
jgi:hypothetical protein